MTPHATRLRLGLAAGAAALAGTAVLAASGAAQSPPTTLHLVSKAQQGVGFMPKGRPHPGDRIGFGDKITGDDTGFALGACTIVGRAGLLCTIQVQLAKGTLSAQGLLPEHARNTPVAIIGGTGAYDGARGTVLATDVNQTTTNLTVNLKP